MKRLLVFILFVVGICGCGLMQPQLLSDVFCDSVEEVVIYSNKNNGVQNVNVVANGVGEIIKFKREYADTYLSQIGFIAGECVILNSNVNINEVLSVLNLKIISEEVFEENKLITGYTYKLPTYLRSDLSKINIQILHTVDKIMVGYPLIMQGF